MRDSLRTFTLFLVLSLGACATSRFDQHFEAGEYTAASRIFEQESALREDEDALFRAGLIYALPTSPVYDPARARALFDELIELHPNTKYRADLPFLEGLLLEIERLDALADNHHEMVRRLEKRLEEIEQRAAELDSLLIESRAEVDTLRSRNEELEAELQTRRAEISVLREELDRLKAIDLGGRRTRGGTPPEGGMDGGPGDGDGRGHRREDQWRG